MKTTKKHPNYVMIVVGLLLSGYIGYLAAGAWQEGIKLEMFLDRFTEVCAYPLRDYFNRYTVKFVCFFMGAFLIFVIMYYTSQRNYMPGREYGTARLADPKKVSRVLGDKDESRNRILSQNFRMSLDTRHTKLNNNVLIIGGSGAGKTFYEVKPNLMQMNTSFITTDPKGEILRSEGDLLRKNGYNVKVINLLEMSRSDCYNPFVYIREESDIVKLVTNLMKNTTPKGSTPSDPFWEHAEGMFLQALFYYVWLEERPERRNFSSVLKLMAEAEVAEQGKPSKLDLRMTFLAETSPLKESHPAVKQYRKCMRGAGDTVRSIIISANSRLATLENPQVLRLLSKDDLNLAELGIGVNGDGKTKTAVFCVIPDSDKSYNFVIGLLYTQIFQELYYQADFKCGGRLPVHVTFMLDEFSNVALPDDFCSLLSTMRSREISSVIIIQNLAQIKALFKDTWETIPGNCDSLVYLGGNESSTHEYISKMLGKATIDKKSSGETRGRQGSSSRNYDVLGREIMTPDEVRKMDNRKCLVFVRGFDPILDDKYFTPKHPMFEYSGDGKFGEPYEHEAVTEGSMRDPEFFVLSERSVKYYEKLAEDGEEVYIDTLSYEEFMMLDEWDVQHRFTEMAEQEDKEQYYSDAGAEVVYDMEPEDADDSEDTETGGSSFFTGQAGRKAGNGPLAGKEEEPGPEDAPEQPEDSISYRMLHMGFTKEQKTEVMRALAAKVPKEVILSYFYPETSVMRMRELRREYGHNEM